MSTPNLFDLAEAELTEILAEIDAEPAPTAPARRRPAGCKWCGYPARPGRPHCGEECEALDLIVSRREIAARQ